LRIRNDHTQQSEHNSDSGPEGAAIYALV